MQTTVIDSPLPSCRLRHSVRRLRPGTIVTALRAIVAQMGDVSVGGVGSVAKGVADVEQPVVLERSSNSRDRPEVLRSGLAG